MRIAHFSDSHDARPDGIVTSVGRTCALLRREGHEVRHFRPGGLLRRRPDELPSLPYPARKMRVALPWGSGPAERADVVHSHSTGPGGMTGFAYAAKHRLPLVITYHLDMLAYVRHYPDLVTAAASAAHRLGIGWGPREYLELLARADRRHARLSALGRGLFQQAGVVIAPSRKMAAALTEIGGLRELRVLPTPVTAPPAVVGRAATRARLGLPEQAPVVLHVGRVTPEKNPGLVLAAFAEVRRVRADARLVFVGASRGAGAVRRAADRLGIGAAVLLLAPVPHARIGDYYRMADVFAHPSLTDTQAMVVAEAEASGLPVVMADAALAERFDATLPDRVHTAPEPSAFAAALLRMLGDEDLRRTTIEAGRADAAAYPPDRYLKDLLSVYDRVTRNG